jgi:hypothetical protein
VNPQHSAQSSILYYSMLPGDDRTVNGMLGIVAVGTPSSGRSGKWEFYVMDAGGSNARNKRREAGTIVVGSCGN